jgi:YD repeat-containing protein
MHTFFRELIHRSLPPATAAHGLAMVSRAKFTYTYQPNNHNIATQTFHHRAGTTPPKNDFGYDKLDRVSSVQYLSTPADHEVFPMDDLGNRTGVVEQRDAAHTHTYTPQPPMNRYSAVDGQALAYDWAGNLICDRQGYHYEYDYDNRIVRIYKLNGQTQTTVASFDYNALGHRVRKVDTIGGRTTLNYHNPD